MPLPARSTHTNSDRLSVLPASPRSRALLRLVVTIVLLFAAVRLGLLIFNGEWAAAMPLNLIRIFALGALFDLAVALWWALPLALLYLLWPQRRALHTLRYFSIAISLIAFGVLGFVAIAEFVFWNEFASRFNFIAVDYLIYSREVIGNVQESYQLPGLLALAGVLAAAAMLVNWRAQRRVVHASAQRLAQRAGWFLALVVGASLLTALLDTRWKEGIGQTQLAQLSGNGPWEFFHAFRYNEIDYEEHYRTLPLAQAQALARAQWQDSKRYRLTGSTQMPIEREVLSDGPVRSLNVVMVSIESLGAEFVESLGGAKGLTPQLDRLGSEGIFFSRLYATGTRTVRGLEALTLSVPPTPGHAIPMRPNHSGLFTLGGLLKQKGYDPVYLYGGYSYFDNMKSFFGGNGYTVIDRSFLDKKDISHENIWGVADEDLFNLAIREIDTRVAAGKRVFAHVMTTSNHRPYTFPDGRIERPIGTARDAAVKYGDYAIGKFVADAKAKPWFNNTLFVFVADHTSIGRDSSDLPLEKYHIPMVIYAPQLLQPARVDAIVSQIDVAPTILGLLNLPYTSQFFGRDALKDGPGDSPIFMANYQTVGYVGNGLGVVLRPRQESKVLVIANGKPSIGPSADGERDRAIAVYQTAARRFSGRVPATP